MRLFTIVFICLLVCAFHVVAQPRLIFSSLPHPAVKSKYQPLVISVYRGLGFEVDIVEMLDERETISVAEGLIDGAIVKSQTAISRYPTIVKVPPKLLVAARYLLCQPGLECSKSILQQTDKIIGMTMGTYNNWGRHFHAKAHSFGSLESLMQVFLHKRLNYILYGDELGLETSHSDAPYQVVQVDEMIIYHVLAEKHKALVPKVSEVLRRKLLEISTPAN